MQFHKENDSLLSQSPQSPLLSPPETTTVTFQDYFDDSLDDDELVFTHNNHNLINNSINEEVSRENNININNGSHQDFNETIGVDVPFEYVIHEQQNDGYFHSFLSIFYSLIKLSFNLIQFSIQIILNINENYVLI
jgi:hypothetical protein